MLQENLLYLRKQKGLSQEDLAMSLHVVRQTISKWEKGLSVPDADMLIRLASILDVSVSVLLGENMQEEASSDEIAQKLENLNTILAEKLRFRKRIWRIIKFILIGILLFSIVMLILAIGSSITYQNTTTIERVDQPQ